MIIYFHIFIFQFSQPTGNTLFVLTVVPATVALQVFAACHITYYKRKYKKEDSTIYPIQIKSEANLPKAEQPNSNPPQASLRLNTSNYNQILFETNSMVIWCAMLIILLLTILCVRTIAKTNEMLIHISDLIVMFIVNVICPCVFYVCNCNARMYIKRLFING